MRTNKKKLTQLDIILVTQQTLVTANTQDLLRTHFQEFMIQSKLEFGSVQWCFDINIPGTGEALNNAIKQPLYS